MTVPVPERGNEGIDACDLNKKSIEDAQESAKRQQNHQNKRPGKMVVGLETDREDFAKDDIVSERDINFSGDHGNHGREGKQGDHGLVAHDEPGIQPREKCARKQNGEQNDEAQGDEYEAVNGERPEHQSREAGKTVGGKVVEIGFESVGFERLHTGISSCVSETV